MNSAGGDRHHLAQRAPILLEEHSALQIDLGMGVAANVVVPLHRHRVAFELADCGPGVQVVDAAHAQPFGDHAERYAMILLPRVSAVAGAVHVQHHVILAAPVGHRLDRSPADHQIDHHYHRAEFFRKLGTPIHFFHGAGSHIQIMPFDFAGCGRRAIDGFHHKQKAVAPMHEGLRVDILVILHEVQAAFQAFIHHAAIIAARQAELWFGGRAEQWPSEFIQRSRSTMMPVGGPGKVLIRQPGTYMSSRRAAFKGLKLKTLPMIDAVTLAIEPSSNSERS